ncbi:hypothetical protein EDC96DRAFT_298299 [Choanephora cucurbitarum]|nr:hypothetical protein EDC96DRAFT_298299 [Choanephora cucurbitarum]
MPFYIRLTLNPLGSICMYLFFTSVSCISLLVNCPTFYTYISHDLLLCLVAVRHPISNIQYPYIDFWHSVISIRHLMQRHSLSSPHPIYFTLVVTTFSTCPGLNYLFIWFFLNRIVSAFTLARCAEVTFSFLLTT